MNGATPISAIQGARLDIVHVNVDFPRVDASIGSDHEPLVVRLGFDDQVDDEDSDSDSD